jgi:hypothetical protein
MAVVGVVALLVWSWYLTGLAAFEASTAIAVVGTGGVAMGAGARWWRRPARPVPVTFRQAAPWVVVGAALAAWQLAAFVQVSRDDHPTISSVANAAFDGRGLRTLAFAAWAVTAAWLARR